MLGKNLLDPKKFFLTLRSGIFFEPRIYEVKTRDTFLEISNIKFPKKSTKKVKDVLQHHSFVEWLNCVLIK